MCAGLKPAAYSAGPHGLSLQASFKGGSCRSLEVFLGEHGQTKVGKGDAIQEYEG